MAFSLFKILSGLRIRSAGTLTPTEVDILPGGTASTKTTVQAAQTVDRTLTLPDATDTLVGKATTDTLTNKTIVVANNTITTAASGDLSATELNAALAELQAEITANAGSGSAALQAHIDDPTGAHAASAISNVPAGNLAATDVQGALNELQGSIDTNITDIGTVTTGLANHIADTVDAHDASAISNTPSGNLSATDIQGAVNELQTDVDTRATSVALTAHTGASAGVHGVVGSVVGTTDTQVLTNKDIDGGTASNSSRITLPKAAKATLDGLTRKEGTVVYASDTDKMYVDDGVTLKEVGSGSGEIDFLANGRGQAGSATGWVLYDNASGSRPTTGTGGTAAGLTIASSATTPLRFDTSLLLTKDAANRQGMGWSYDFTINNDSKAKVISITKRSLVASGTFVAGSPTTDSDVIIYMYDVTNSTLIQPSSFKILANSSTISDDMQYDFQTSATGSTYRLIVHVATTSASAYGLQLDMSVSPSKYVYGTPITDWQTYTPTGSVTTNATYTGRIRRVGDSAEVRVTMSFTGTNTQGDWTFTETQLFNGLGLTINDSKIASITSSSNFAALGCGGYEDVGTASRGGMTVWFNKATRLIRITGAIFSDVTPASNSPITIASGDSFSFSATVPVTGWSSSVQMSDSADTRVVAFTGASTLSTTLPNATPTLYRFDVVNNDTHGAYNSTTGIYTVPTAGYYQTNVGLLTSSTAWGGAAGTFVALEFYRNSVSEGRIAYHYIDSGLTQRQYVGGSKTAYFNAGETISIYALTNGSSSAIGASSDANIISIIKVNGPAAIAASETIAAVYNESTGQVIPTLGATVNFANREIDTHNAVTTGASWVFTAPAAGIYDITAQVVFSAHTPAAGTNGYNLRLNKNGSLLKVFGDRAAIATTSQEITCAGNIMLRLNAGETISFIAWQNTGSSQALIATNQYHWVSIKRIGL